MKTVLEPRFKFHSLLDYSGIKT